MAARNDDGSVSGQMAELKRAASERAGLDDFGGLFFEGPLAAWIEDLNHANLNDFGRKFLRRLAVRDLERRLKVLDYFRTHPEIGDVEIPPILFVTGSPRTGTTLLHHLLATHPLGRSFLRWELMEPLPPPVSRTYAADPRIARLQSSIEPLRGSLLERMHWVNADEPEENAWGFIDCTGLLGCGVRPAMPTWSQWLSDHDLRSSFQEYRKMVQLLIWKCPPPDGGHLVLKCVMTTLWVRSFADVFPEAKFVITHRDPFRALVSSCTAGDAICQPFIGEPPGPLFEEGLRGQDTFNLQKRVLTALKDFAGAEPQRARHVLYSDLMDDAVAGARSVYEHFDMPIPGDLEPRILGYLEAQRGGRRAAPPRKLDLYGYDHRVVWEDPVVAEYREFFGLRPEQTRLSDTRTGK